MPRHSEDGICFKDRQSRYRARQVFMHFRLAVSAAAKVREAKSASRALSVSVFNDKSTAKSTETTVNAKAKAFDSCMVTQPLAQAVRCRRRHQPRRPPLAKIRPGSPAPAMGPGTLLMAA